ncbi:MAG: DUF429 domain-containing protein [Pseudanabaenaceae cyanobacterium bins.39]|nr:DUF429 domain-containing protein [Pseudanabaenaceae cyanobacterium bins.39]
MRSRLEIKADIYGVKQLILGVDFTSAPSKTKPIVCGKAWLDRDRQLLQFADCDRFTTFDDWMAWLREMPTWIAGVDFPLGLPRRLIENLQWGAWPEYVQRVGQMTKPEFVETLNQYRQGRNAGDREHLRATDQIQGAISPMKVYGVPVGKMFFEGAPRLWAAGFSILPCHPTHDPRTVFEIYPALMARRIIGRQSYKSDQRHKQTLEMQSLRQQMIDGLREHSSLTASLSQGLTLEIGDRLAQLCVTDASGDTLDALFATLQTAAAAQIPNYGIPDHCDRLEGWICG